MLSAASRRCCPAAIDSLDPVWVAAVYALNGPPERGADSTSAFGRMTADLIERLVAVHATQIVEADFAHRTSVFQRAQADPKAFWRGDIIPEPDDWKTFRGQPYSYWAYLTEHEDTTLETGVAYVLQTEREHGLAALRSAYAANNVEVLQAEARALLAPYDNVVTELLRAMSEKELAELRRSNGEFFIQTTLAFYVGFVPRFRFASSIRSCAHSGNCFPLCLTA